MILVLAQSKSSLLLASVVVIVEDSRERNKGLCGANSSVEQEPVTTTLSPERSFSPEVQIVGVDRSGLRDFEKNLRPNIMQKQRDPIEHDIWF